jgi:hypothetical protein
MKSLFYVFTTVFLIGISINTTAQCLPNGIVFSTQSDIDNFQTNYPGCTEIEGKVIIKGNITNINGLSVLTSIGGNLTIRINDNLIDLSGLENLNSIGGKFYLDQNDALTSISSLNNLTEVGGDFTIRICNALPNLSGLDNLATIGGKFNLDQNDALTSISSLNNLTQVGGDFTIRICDALIHLSGLENLATIGGKFYLDQNNALTSISSLNNLTEVGGGFTIRICDALTHLSGLENLATIGGNFHLDRCNSLTDLAGLENLTSINGLMFINSNAGLTSLSGIQNIDPSAIESGSENLADLIISHNPLLTECEMQSICEFLSLPDKTNAISDNATGCNSSVEVNEACNIVGIDNINALSNKISLYPNPANGRFTINLEKTNQLIANISLLDSFGRIHTEIYELENRKRINIETANLSAGIYIVRIRLENNEVIYKKVLINN